MYMEYISLQDEKSVYLITESSSVQEGLNNISKRVDGNIRNAYLTALFLDEKIAKNGVSRYLNYFRRDPITAGTIVLAVSKTEMNELYESEVTKKRPLGDTLQHIITNNGPHSFQIPTQTLDEFYSKVRGEGIDPYLPYIRGGSEDFGTIGIVLFKNDKMVGKIDENLSQALLISRHTARSGRISVNVEESDQIASFYSFIKSAHIIPKIENGKVVTNINLRLQCYLTESPRVPNMLEDKEVIKKFERSINKDIKGQVERLFNILQNDYQVDPIGIGKIVKARYPSYFRKVNWRKEFKRMEIKVDVRSNIRIISTTT